MKLLVTQILTVVATIQTEPFTQKIIYSKYSDRNTFSSSIGMHPISPKIHQPTKTNEDRHLEKNW